MPCGDNRILTAFFDYLADRAGALGDPSATSLGSESDAGLVQALLESRRVVDVLDELAVLLEIDVTPLHAFIAVAQPVSSDLAAVVS